MLKGEWFASCLLPNTAKNKRGNRAREIINNLLDCKRDWDASERSAHVRNAVAPKRQDSFLYLLLRNERRGERSLVVEKSDLWSTSLGSRSPSFKWELSSL
jgi:hypothetical protein